MGSQITKNYDVDKEPSALVGLSNLWKMYKGVKKDKLKTPVSIFIFEKKYIDKQPKSTKEAILNNLRKESSSLAKFKHPGILNLYEPLIEDAKMMAFVTEPVESSLAFLEQKLELVPSELEAKILIIELCETLSFLHNTAKTVHLSLSPENLYLTPDNKIKISGFSFSQQLLTNEAEVCNFDFLNGTKISETMIPNLKFIAPEVTSESKCSKYSDIFSLGCIIYFLIQLCRTDKLKNNDLFLLKMTDLINSKQHIYECDALDGKKDRILSDLGNPSLAMLIGKLINVKYPVSRGDALEVINNQWFSDPLIKALHYLEKLNEKDQNSKVQFLNGLSTILDKFENRVLTKKVLPVLIDTLQYESLSTTILPCLMKLLEKENLIKSEDFNSKVWPAIQKLTSGKEMPAQALYMLLKNTELFCKHVDAKEFQNVLLPLILKSLECGVPKLQEAALHKIPFISKKVEYNVLKSQILPRILHLVVETKVLQLKLEALNCIKEFLSTLDRTTMTEIILPSMDKLRKSDNDGKVCMLILEMNEIMTKALGSEITANKILPNMIPVLMTGSLSKDQFKKYVISIKRMLDGIEVTRMKDLEEASTTIENETFNFDQFGEGLNKVKTAKVKTNETGGVFDFLDILDNASEMPINNTASFPFQIPQVQQESNVQSNILPQNVPNAFQNEGKRSSGLQPIKPPQNSKSNDINRLFSGIGEEKKNVAPVKEGWDFGDDILLSNSKIEYNNPGPAFNLAASNLQFGQQKKGNLLNMKDDPFADLNSEINIPNNNMSGFNQQFPQTQNFNNAYGSAKPNQFSAPLGNLGGVLPAQQPNTGFSFGSFPNIQTNNMGLMNNNLNFPSNSDDFFEQFSNEKNKNPNFNNFNNGTNKNNNSLF